MSNANEIIILCWEMCIQNNVYVLYRMHCCPVNGSIKISDLMAGSTSKKLLYVTRETQKNKNWRVNANDKLHHISFVLILLICSSISLPIYYRRTSLAMLDFHLFRAFSQVVLLLSPEVQWTLSKWTFAFYVKKTFRAKRKCLCKAPFQTTYTYLTSAPLTLPLPPP